MENFKSALIFEAYVVNAVTFQRNEKYQENGPIDIKMNIGTHFEKDGDNGMQVFLKVHLFEDEDETKFPFSMQIEVIGFFVLSGEDRKAKIEDFKANAVAILFPYVRSLISSYTANANVPPLIIPPINVNRLLKSKKEE